MKVLRKEKGITLIALAVTIIVMLILAGVTIAALTSENGIINQASKVKETSKVAKTEEEARLEYSNLILEKQMEGHGEETELSDVIGKLEENGYETGEKDGKNYIKIGEYYYEIKLENEQVSIAREKTEGITGGNGGSGTGGGSGSGTVASNSQSYVGYYADIDGKGNYGIIYADLVAGKKGTTTPLGPYTIDTIAAETAKTYQVSEEDYEDVLGGTNKIIKGTGSGADRFYVMALSDIGTTYYTWYKNAYGKMNASDTQIEFGKGKSNTTTINGKWLANNAEEYGLQDANDMWGQIQEKISAGWFVPSKAEWSAFAGELGITCTSSGNYSTKGLKNVYWSSSQNTTIRAWCARFSNGNMLSSDVVHNCCVRLSTTF